MPTEEEQQITITLPVKDALVRHIEHLQDVITKRNARIEALEEEVKRLTDGEPSQRALQEAYKRGRDRAIRETREAVDDTVRALGRLNAKAHDVYRREEFEEAVRLRKEREEANAN